VHSLAAHRSSDKSHALIYIGFHFGEVTSISLSDVIQKSIADSAQSNTKFANVFRGGGGSSTTSGGIGMWPGRWEYKQTETAV
jgi:hypothetical protein